MKKDNRHTFIDLFSGAGGMSYGFEMAGFRPILAIDNWQDALDTYALNNPGIPTLCADLSSLDIEEVAARYRLKDVDLIVGGPPCQGFSVAGKRIVDDVRNRLYKSFVRFVEVCKPRAFVMENVPNILSIGGGCVKESIIGDFSALGYDVNCRVLTASDFGVPQNRRRAIFVGVKKGKFSFPEPYSNERVTASQAISDLPEATLSDGSAYTEPASSKYQEWARMGSAGVYNQEATVHSDRTVRIISLVPDGGNYKDLPLNLQDTRKVHIAWTRLCSTKPSITIDTGHRHYFHYRYNRIPTVRECARIQSFPDRYIFLKSRTSQYKQVGNAVPPLMAKAIAESVNDSLKQEQLCIKSHKSSI
ncbi:MAG: DNA cytosine methyltransferase [Bacteroidia bacterium]|nr:DNA cytosine methyltransferase [Bacteroidia bacterium]